MTALAEERVVPSEGRKQDTDLEVIWVFAIVQAAPRQYVRVGITSLHRLLCILVTKGVLGCSVSCQLPDALPRPYF